MLASDIEFRSALCVVELAFLNRRDVAFISAIIDARKSIHAMADRILQKALFVRRGSRPPSSSPQHTESNIIS
jgi:hypothetical protein